MRKLTALCEKNYSLKRKYTANILNAVVNSFRKSNAPFQKTIGITNIEKMVPKQIVMIDERLWFAVSDFIFH
ncbi:MAG: hypothetical protein M3342_19305 [Bacteroidota bacterium]|nr:hypothetical protein [Flavisolibacter sp.]MBD0374273.1 hypothetical protein [Flavisolibacter sp.]MDQ3846130.1 hypothetical protein [Bacteroidota bacterium]